MPTANETLVWGPNIADQFSMIEPDKYGDYGMQFAGGTWDAYGPQNGWGTPRVGNWWELAGMAQVRDPSGLPCGTASTRCSSATSCSPDSRTLRRRLRGRHLGVFGVDVPEEGLTIDADSLSGSFTLDAISPVDGMLTWVSGFGDDMWFRNQDVPLGKHPGEFPPPDLLDAGCYTFEVTSTYGIEAQTFGPSTSDIDLYLLYDANNDGIFNIYDNRELLGTCRLPRTRIQGNVPQGV